MAEQTAIEWTDATWQIITGCSVLSAGCRRCYAMRLAGTRLRNHPSRAGLTIDTKAGPVWTGEVRFNKQWAHQPLEWRKPRMIFVCAHADLFHERVPDDWIDHVFAVASLCPQHTFQILTKRARRMREYFAAPNVWARIEVAARVIHKQRTGEIIPGKTPIGPLRNCWLGVSAEDQRNANERLDDLIHVPAHIRWVSAEPLLGAIDFSPWMSGLDWIVVGGESQHDARPMHPDWVRSIRDQCASATVPMLFKQWGSHSYEYDRDRDDPDYRTCDAWSRKPGRWINLAGGHGFNGERVHYAHLVGKKRAGRTLDGVIHNGFPTTLVQR